MDEAAQVTVELFGIPRKRAGRAEVRLPAGSVQEVLAHLRQACPGLSDLCRPDGALAPHYLLAIDGRSFVGDLGRPLAPGTRLLLLTADVGG